VVFFLVCCCALVGCGAAPVTDETQAPEVTYPTSGESLQTRGIDLPPAELLWLPSDVNLTYTASQENLLIVIGVPGDAPKVESYLHDTLPMLGWTITNQDLGGLLFETSQWHGGFAVSSDSWALTVRND
jgi:hypothetical protein